MALLQRERGEELGAAAGRLPAVQGQDAQGESDGREMLPTNVRPRHYDLLLDLDVNATEYTGEVKVELDILADTTSITLNANELDITDASLIVPAYSQPTSTHALSNLQVSYNADVQTATLTLPTSAPLLRAHSTATLTLTFHGQLKENMCGLFRSSWLDPVTNAKKYQISSQFEPVDARTAFPCWDEPGLKATFGVTLLIVDDDNDNDGLVALSNMPEKRATKIVVDGTKKKRKIEYETTPLISTYLIAFAVGEMDCISTRSFRLPIRLFTSKNNNVESGWYALELAARTLNLFEEKLGIAFPLPKIDLITVPDFLGAMEHWGLITYREDMLLFDEKTGTIAQKRLLGDAVTHELAHQWFGNLTTMAWWDGLWLNEGFAVWASFYALDILEPEWHVQQNFLFTEMQQAYDLDSLRNSHPIEAPVRTADEVEQIFDAVSYSKGCSVIRMIAAYMGQDVFLRGVSKYLKKHQFGNATTMALWDALSNESGMDIAKIMGRWTLHVGHPIVAVKELGDSLHLEQHRFLRRGDVRVEEDQVLYPIPLNIRTADGKDRDLIFDTRGIEVPLQGDFVKLNTNHIGFYRTAYSSERLAKLGMQLRSFSVEDRIGIVSDAAALACAGYQSTADLLSLLENYRNEENVFVWKQVVAVLDYLGNTWMFEDEAVLDGLEKFHRDLVSPKAHQLGWDLAATRDEDQQQLMALLFEAAALSGDEQTQNAAADMFKRFRDGDRDAIHPDIRSAVFASVLKHANGSEEFDAILNEVRTAKTMDERNVGLRALGHTRKPDQIQQLLALMLTEDIKKQEVEEPLHTLSTHQLGLQAAWQWLKTDTERIRERVDEGISVVFGDIIGMCAANFSSAAAAEEFAEFWTTQDTKSYDQSIAQCGEEIRIKAAWLDRAQRDVKQWLQARS